MYVIVLFIVFLAIYFAFVREEAPSRGTQTQETKAQTTTDEPPKPSDTEEGIDPFKSPVAPSS
ncbi:MAG TPA: hypothetical protein VGA95_09485 [Thermodesulfobacteriota bacterium]|jgi:hypothetical protein